MQLQTDLSGTCCILNMQLCRNIAARDSQGACAAVVPIASWTTLNVPSGICRHILMSQTLMLKSSVVIITTIMITLSSLSKARYMQDKQSLTAIKHPDETGACIWSGFLSQQTGVPAGIFSGSVSFSLHSGQLPLQPTHLHHKSSYSAAVHQDTSLQPPVEPAEPSNKPADYSCAANTCCMHGICNLCILHVWNHKECRWAEHHDDEHVMNDNT